MDPALVFAWVSVCGGGVAGIAQGFAVLSAVNAVSVLLMLWLYRIVPSHLPAAAGQPQQGYGYSVEMVATTGLATEPVEPAAAGGEGEVAAGILLLQRASKRGQHLPPPPHFLRSSYHPPGKSDPLCSRGG